MPITSVMAYPNGKAYLFQGSTYSRYDFRTGVAEATGVAIAGNWPNLPSNAPDAALYWGFNKAYFFYGNEYLRYDVRGDTVDSEYLPPNSRPQIVPNWGGLPAPLNALVNWGNGKLYGFAGSLYYRYDITLERVDPGYPLPIQGNWPGVWPTGINDVLYQGGRYAYFFKDEEYIRYDVYTDGSDPVQPLSGLTLDPVPSGMFTAVRDLTLRQANEVMGYLIDQGKFTLNPAQTPYNGPWTAITLPAPTAHVVVKPPMLDGVTYENVIGAATVIDNVDQRMLVALYRLTRWLNASEPTIEKILHLGIGHGKGPPNDCHNQGRALDFAGIVGTSNGLAFTKMILNDWGNLPSNGAPLRLNPVADPVTYQQFLTAFRFGTFECECNGIGSANTWPAKDIGDPGGLVIHPDYVDVPPQVLRPDHKNHIHMQVGLTLV
jgi:Hemopexin